jgi:DNA primase
MKMKFRNQRLSVEEARQIDLVNYLSTRGCGAVKIRNDDYWYLSPLRNETTPSFKVNRKLNRWYDHGLGKGGNIIDFANPLSQLYCQRISSRTHQ